MKIDLGGFLRKLAPALTTKIVSQLAGSKAGEQFAQSTGAGALDVATLKAEAQPLVEDALAQARPELESVVEAAVDALITEFVPAELQAAAIVKANAAIEAKIGAFDVKL